jgi:hypothetical protein
MLSSFPFFFLISLRRGYNMSGSPVTQAYKVSLLTSIPATILGQSSLGFLNAIGSGAWNDSLGGVLTLEHFVGGGLDVTSSSVTGSTWSDINGKCALNFTFNTVSDPVTAEQIQVAIEGAFGLLVVAIGAAIAAWGPPGWAWDALGGFLVLVGAIALLSVSVTLLASTTAGKIILYGGLAVGAGLLIFAVYLYASNAQVKRNVNKAAGRLTKRVAAYA